MSKHSKLTLVNHLYITDTITCSYYIIITTIIESNDLLLVQVKFLGEILCYQKYQMIIILFKIKYNKIKMIKEFIIEYRIYVYIFLLYCDNTNTLNQFGVSSNIITSLFTQPFHIFIKSI